MKRAREWTATYFADHVFRDGGLSELIRAAQIDALNAAAKECRALGRDDGTAWDCADAIAALIEEVERGG